MALPAPKTNVSRVIANSPQREAKPTPKKTASTYRKTAANNNQQSIIGRQRNLQKATGQTQINKTQLQSLRTTAANKPNPIQKAKEGVTKAAATMATATRVSAAVETGIAILSVYIWLYLFQFFAALLFAGALWFGANEETLSAFFPIQTILGLGWLIASGIGFITLIVSFLIFAAEPYLNLYNSPVLLSFFLCIGLSLAPITFIIPWPAIWILLVIWAQTIATAGHKR